MSQTFITVEEYITLQPEESRSLLRQLRSEISKIVPEATEVFSYGVPGFYLNGNLVLYAGFKKHIGFYPQPSAIKKFKPDLEKFETSEGTIKFSLDKPLPLELIRKIVKFRVHENAQKVMSRKK